MPKENNSHRDPMRGPSFEKAKDFKSAIKRLFHELNTYKILIIVSFILAIFGSILSILAPNKLSDLTDEISKGLIVNQNNMKELTKKASNNLNEKTIKKMIPEILSIDTSKENIQKIMMDQNISSEDKAKFTESMKNMQKEDGITSLVSLPRNILDKLVKETTYNGIKISTEDKINLLSSSKDLKNIELSENMQKVFFKEITIDKISLSANDQYTYLKTMSKLNKKNNEKELYKTLDTLPKNVKKVIEPTMNMKKIKNIALLLLCMYLTSALFTYIQSICMTNVSNKFAKNLRSRISIKINNLPLKYFDKHIVGDILSRITNDVDMIAQSMNQSLASLVSSVTLFLGTIIMMFITNWVLALTAIIASLIGFIGMIFILKNSQKYFTERQKQLGNLNGHIEEIYSGLNVVKTYNGKADANKKFDLYNSKVCESNKKSQFLSGLMQPIMAFIGNFGYVAVCIVGAMLTMKGYITFGVIVAFITYVRLFTSPLGQIAQATTSLQSTAAASERVFEFLDEKEMTNEKNITKYLDKKKVKGNIDFENVVFKYDGNDNPTIKNFTAHAKAGQKVAIVGPTGAGKTTMVNLLMKFYNIESGDIKIDGVSTKDLSRSNIHDLFTMVLQDTWLFEGTIKENIVYNQKNISDKKVEKVCDEVGLGHFIKTLSKGYNTVLSDNESVSAGQRQLLTIARGMLQEAPFLILDEATSNVDTRTEELVQKAMDKLTEGRTSFIIAHRLSTIKNADLILVMKDGNIIEQGNHDELMKKNGFYANLYNSQFEK
mgnify:CR=1 FL=1